MPKLSMISFSFNKGGAGIAANKFRELLLDNTEDFQVDLISQNTGGTYQFLKRLISLGLSKFQFNNNPTKHSLNLFSFGPLLKSLINPQNKLYHLHWINNDTLSIFDFHKIPSGSVVTLHDEWLYCGSEHYYKVSDNSKDFIYGYDYFKKGIIGIHWNSLIWKIKYKKLAHRRDLIYTVPSNWMLQRAKSSAILKASDIRLLPNPINTEIFKNSPEQATESFREFLKIDSDSFVIVFGAISGNKNKLKGMDLLNSAIELLRAKPLKLPISKIIFVDFGGTKGESKLHGFRNISLGHINDATYLAKLYSTADCVVVPSMVEAFGQIAAESLSCSTPIVSFDTSGLRDIVTHNHSGLFAEPFSVSSFCEQLLKIIESPKKVRLKMGENGRKHILENFSYTVIKSKYLNVLQDANKLSNIRKK